jgi:rubrerythrin
MPARDPSGSIERFAAMRKALRDAVNRSDRRGRTADPPVRYFCEEHGFVVPRTRVDLRCPDCGATLSRVGNANP